MFISALFAVAVAAPNVEVPFRLGEDAIIVDTTVNGRQVSLMFDTGFSASVQVNDAINIGKQTGTMRLRDFVGELDAPTVKITSLKVGDQPIETKDLPPAILAPGDYSDSYNTHCDGILGFSVIKNAVTGINYEKKKFVFYPKGTDISKWVPDNKKTFMAKLLPMGNSSMEMLVDIGKGQQMTLALDTGNAFYATTHRDVLERVGVWPVGKNPLFVKQSFVASGPVDSWDIQLKDLKIFGVPVPTSVWNIIDLPSSSAEGDGTVGYGFLHNFNIVVDYEHRRVWLENYSGKTADEPEADPGITAGPDRKGSVRVYRVSPGGPADKAGVKAGDTLISIDDAEMVDIGYRRINNLLKGPKGSKVNVALSRAGRLMRLTLERAYLFNEASAG